MLTNKARYGLRAMCALAQAGAMRLQAHAIARASQRAGEVLRGDPGVRKAGFIDSRRGQRGGHAPTRPASQIPVGDLIRAIDGLLAPVRCASISAYEPLRGLRRSRAMFDPRADAQTRRAGWDSDGRRR